MFFRIVSALIAGLPLAFGSPLAAQPIAPEIAQRIESHAEHYVDNAAFDGLVVIANVDDIVYSHAFGQADYRFPADVTLDTRFRIGSLSKQVTKAAIGRLIDAGQVRYDAPLSQYLPDFPRADDMTIAQLLNHRAGVAHTNDMDWMDMTRPMSFSQIIERLSQEPLAFEPDERYGYSNGGYAVLAAVIERVSGLDYEAFLRQQFGRAYPSIGHVDGFEIVPGLAYGYAPGPRYGERVESETYLVGNRIGGGSLYAAADDLLRFFRDCYTGDIMTPATRALLFPRPEDGESVITGRSPGTLAKILMDFESGLTVLTLSSNSAWPPRMTENIAQIYRGEEPRWAQPDLTPGVFATEDLETYTGNYNLDTFGWNDVVVYRLNNSLVLARGAMRTAFVPAENGEFFLPIFDWICAFTQDKSRFSCRQTDPEADAAFEFSRRD